MRRTGSRPCRGHHAKTTSNGLGVRFACAATIRIGSIVADAGLGPTQTKVHHDTEGEPRSRQGVRLPV